MSKETNMPDNEHYTDYDEVIQLTEYNGGGDVNNQYNMDFGSIAPYEKIELGSLSDKYQEISKKFVDKVKSFVIGMNDAELTKEHKEYMEAVAEIEMSSLSDLLYLCAINKNMINNVVNKLDAVQIEDYALLNSYNSLVNQHMKLIKEMMIQFKSIPGIMKRMKTEVITDQLLPEGQDSTNLPTSESFMNAQENEFSNRKEMLRKLAAEIESEN